ncbi:MAG: hypothetical protein PHG82_00485 [Candidatus Gracilibacteria bacterium]|nr:hypothetical protein [Candidatus Gracilibacteria bacterium]
MKTKFKELYYLESIDEEIEQEIDFKNFVFCGANWGFYFTSKVHENCEKIENVELVKGDFSKQDPKWIDYDEELDLNLIYS